MSGQQVIELSVGNISGSPYQPRKAFDEAKITELANSIREKGLLQPIIVRCLDKETETYELIAGERRLRAHQRLGRETILAIVREVSDDDARDLVLIENLQREDLTIMEEAHSIVSLVEHHQGNRQLVAQKIGKGVVYVSERIAFLTLPNDVQQMLDKGEITIAQTKVLLELDGESAQKKAAKLAVKLNLNASQLRGRMQQHLKKGGGASCTGHPSITFDQLSNGLIRIYDMLYGYDLSTLHDADKRETLRKQLDLVGKIIIKNLGFLVPRVPSDNGADPEESPSVQVPDGTIQT